MLKKETKKKKPLIKSESILYGIEIEFTRPNYRDSEESRDVNLGLQKAIEGTKYAKDLDATGRDGGGVECRINPFSFEFFQKTKDFFDFVAIAKEHKFLTDTSNEAGVHIHVDRKIFSTISFKKFIAFLTTYRDFLHKISNRRSRSSFTNVATREGKCGTTYGKENEEKYLTAFKDRTSLYGNNCIVLNSHGDSGTVECRFFNSTGEPWKLHAYLQFIRSLCYFCKSQRTQDLDNYLAYCVDYRLKYPELVRLLQHYKYLTEHKTPQPITTA